jgi:hypothetical protein
MLRKIELCSDIELETILVKLQAVEQLKSINRKVRKELKTQVRKELIKMDLTLRALRIFNPHKHKILG